MIVAPNLKTLRTNLRIFLSVFCQRSVIIFQLENSNVFLSTLVDPGQVGNTGTTLVVVARILLFVGGFAASSLKEKRSGTILIYS